MRLNHFWINFFLQEKSTCKNSQKSFFQFPLPYAYIKFSWKIISAFILKASYSANCVRRNFHVPDFHICLYQSKEEFFLGFYLRKQIFVFQCLFFNMLSGETMKYKINVQMKMNLHKRIWVRNRMKKKSMEN